MSERPSILFLDFDGVLVTADYQERHGISSLDPEKVALLDRVVRAADARIVVSSSWRSTVGDMQLVLRKFGLWDARNRVIGITPTIPQAIRGAEIDQWLRANVEESAHICIVDDEADMGYLSIYQVQTDYRVGLTMLDAMDVTCRLRGSKDIWRASDGRTVK